MTVKAKVYSATEVATILGVSPYTVYDLMDKGVLPSVRVGKRRLAPRHIIDAIAEGKQYQPGQESAAG